jgi:hypothetical protein
MLNMLVLANAQPFSDTAAGVGIAAIVITYLVFFLFIVIGLWKMFNKAGIPGILAIIPIVNLFFIPKVAGKPGWWGILFFIPLVSVIIYIIICIGVAERFGRGVGTVLGLIFLTPIFIWILAFGSAQWTPPPAEA